MRHYTTQSHRWVFIKQSDRPDHRNLRPFHAVPTPGRSDPGSLRRPGATLLPKLEAHFAEFPDPLSPAVPEAANLGLLMRFSVRCRQSRRTFFNASHTLGNGSRHPPGRRRTHSTTLVRNPLDDARPLDGTENPAPELRAPVRPRLPPDCPRAGISACFPISQSSTLED